MRPLILAAALILLGISELGLLYLNVPEFRLPARLAFVALCPLLMPHFTFREWALTAIAGALALGLLARGGASDALYALDRAAFFAAFIYLVTLLKEAAQRSASVLELGQYMTRQPPGRRYFSLALGGHGLGVFLNFGAISLLTPLIQRGVRSTAQSGQEAEISEQRQISALLRGFSWMIMWSPTALTQAVLFTSFPGVRPEIVIPLGIAASVAMILLGRGMDLLKWRHSLAPAPISQPQFPKSAGRRFSLICAILISATYLMVMIANVSAAVALMLVAPAVMTAWLYAQNFGAHSAGALRATGSALHEIFIRNAKDPARSAFVLGAAGFIGEAAAKIVPVAQIAHQLNIATVPTWIVLAILPVIITLGGQVALSPILVVVFLAAVINELPVLPADPNLIVFALGAGWALSMSASPNASATLLISGITGIAPTKLTWHWNGTYAAVSFLVFVLAFYWLARIFG